MKFTKITDIVYTLTETKGNEHARIFLFYLFPGIWLELNDINIHHIIGTSSEIARAAELDCLRINYCFEGRCEVKLENGKYVYVDRNVLCIEDHPPRYNFHYPLGFYKGIEIILDKKTIQKESSELLELFGISPLKLLEKYADTGKTFIHIASDAFAKKAAEIVSIWERESLEPDVKIYQLRFALCQLLFCLLHDQSIDPDKVYDASPLSHGQYLIAIDCEKKITEDLSKKRTVASLAELYKISPSSLQKFFSQVYGCSISEYLQAVRMETAMRLLTKENCSVMQTSAAVGYENQSKFSAVFKKHTGYAPLEYKRIQNLKRNEENT